VFLNKQH